MALFSRPAAPATADLVLEASTPYGRHWSGVDIPASTRVLADPGRLLADGDVITVHDGRTGARRFLLRVAGREGEMVRIAWLGRDGG